MTYSVVLYGICFPDATIRHLHDGPVGLRAVLAKHRTGCSAPLLTDERTSAYT
jgi:hypothetical protein